MLACVDMHQVSAATSQTRLHATAKLLEFFTVVFCDEERRLEVGRTCGDPLLMLKELTCRCRVQKPADGRPEFLCQR